MEILPQQFRVPGVYGDYWFNSEPIPVGAMRGYVILIDFWDYTCHRCLRTLPYLREWHRRYADKGLVVIGVHTPQFPFARDPINVRRAIEKYGIRYPVVMDNDGMVWGSFRAVKWPTKYLIDRNGFIRYVHAGEGSYAEFEHAVQSMLADAGYHDEFPLVMEPLREEDRSGVVCYRETPEILTGWQRGTIGNIEGYAPESIIHYEDPHYYLEGRLYLSGNWLSERNSIRLVDPEVNGGYLVFNYAAKEVATVVMPEGEKNFQVFVQQDNAYLDRSTRGEDIQIDEEGKSYFLVDDARLYTIVKNKEFGSHTITMTTRSKGFAVYSFSFVSSVIPELISGN